ncbi:MAG: hypothetical protein KGK11_07720 [Sphingomonadales bacterium]|nr:hypothetical protein [Sphingomonadales bacterium]
MVMLTLGDFTFQRGEIPERIAFGTQQQLQVHRLVGGGRVIDAMGAAPLRPEWSGWLSGPAALDRARQLKRMAEAGAPLPLAWGEFAYSVLIAQFSAEDRAGPFLPYRIALEVLEDTGAPAPAAPPPGFAAVLAGDLAGAVAAASAVPVLAAAMTTVSGAMTAALAGYGAQPPAPALRPLQVPIAAATSIAAVTTAGAAQSLSALPVLAGADVAAAGSAALDGFATGLAAAVGAARSGGQAALAGQLLARMSANLAVAIGGGGSGGGTLTTADTDLYHIAAAAYGDARGWTRIAAANGLSDPTLTGITTLTVPPADGSAFTGVLDG